MQLEQRTYSAAIHNGRIGGKWKTSAAGARIPPPQAATSMLRSAWGKPGDSAARPVGVEAGHWAMEESVIRAGSLPREP